MPNGATVPARAATPQRVLVGVVCIMAALRFGLVYANQGGNQLTYLLAGLRRADPVFLQFDWLATDTWAYHPTFSWIVFALARLDVLEWGLAIGNVLVIAASLYVVYRLLRTLAGDDALAAFLGVASLVVVGGTESVGQSYIFSPELQPSGLAALALLVAVLALVERRPITSGIALTVSGAMHANFLLVGLAAFGLAHVFLLLSRPAAERGAAVREAAIQLAAPIGLLALQLPTFLAMADGAASTAAREIFLFIRSPHHYVPARFIADFAAYLGWQLIAVASLRWFRPRREARERFLALLAAMALIVAAATVLTTAVFVPFVSQLFFWRLAPFVVLFAQITAVAAALAWLRHGVAAERAARPEPRDLARAVAALAGGILLMRHAAFRHGPLHTDTLLATLAFSGVVLVFVGVHAGWIVPRAALRRIAGPVLGGAAFAVAIGVRADDALRESNLVVSDIPAAEAELHAWARTTAPSARFLIPPELSSFRLRTARAVVVDWKSTPIKPAGLLEWYRRINVTAGMRAAQTLEQAAAGYAAMDRTRLEALDREFDLDYAVLPRTAVLARAAAVKPAWENPQFVVLDLRDRRH